MEIYELHPDFSLELYRELYDDLKSFNDYDLFEHFHKYGYHEDRIYSYNKFYEKYSNFSLELYTKLHDDLKSFTDIQIFGHFHNYGCREDRIYSYNKFYEKYPDFSLELYRELNNDLKSFTDIQIFGHFHKYGCGEDRIYSYNKFYERYPDFSIKIYKDFNYDLKAYNENKLLSHYHNNGKYENRISSINTFYLVYCHFNDKFFKTFQRHYNECSEIEMIYNFCASDKSTIIYSLKTFYNHYPDFDYNLYRYTNSHIQNVGEVDVIIDWYNNGCDYSFLAKREDTYQKKKNILIYAEHYVEMIGGTVVQYYLAKYIDLFGTKIRIKVINEKIYFKNPYYNNYYEDDLDLNNTVIIYAETIKGNPLNGKYVVRWILAELGIIANKDIYNTWNKDNLVYYFNTEKKFEEYPEKIGTIYKQLSLLCIYDKIQNYNIKRIHNSWCHTFRKTNYHSFIKHIHPDDSFEITREHNQEDYIHFFNQYKYFISYDPLTFINIIAAICGCISIVYPIEGVSKYDWLKMIAGWPYLKENNLDNLYGIAYGIDDIEYAQNTIHLVKTQWEEIHDFSLKNTVLPFLDDINHFENLENTVENNYLL